MIVLLLKIFLEDIKSIFCLFENNTIIESIVVHIGHFCVRSKSQVSWFTRWGASTSTNSNHSFDNVFNFIRFITRLIDNNLGPDQLQVQRL